MGEPVGKRDSTPIDGDVPIQIDLSSAVGPRRSLGQPLLIAVRVTNVSASPILMVGVLPGSEGLRYPHYVPEIEGPCGLEQVRLPEALDYVRGLREEDFVRLAPGESFDPQGQRFIPIQQLAWFRPTQPAVYRIRLCFDATAQDARAWMGSTQSRDRLHVETLIRLVPPVKVWSNILEIDVV